MSLTEISIKRPLLIIMVFMALILFGLLSYKGLKYNLLPSFSIGSITINTKLPGASPSEIQEKVTKPIEDAIATVEGIDYTTSSSLQNVSSIVVSLKSGVNDKQAQQDIERQINQIKSSLPDNTSDPAVNRISPDNYSILNFSITAGKLNYMDLYDLIDKSIKPRISNVPGVGQLNIIGGQQKEIHIDLDNGKLKQYNLSSYLVYQIVAANSSSIPGGDISSNSSHLAISINGDYQDIDVFKTIVLRQSQDGSRIMLSDVAQIKEAQKRIVTINRINGKDGIGIQVFKTTDANAVAVSEQVKKTLLELKQLYAKYDLRYEIASDQSIFTLAAADGVMEDLGIAILIVGFVMLLFLHSIRSSLFVLVALPSAMIPTFILMYVMNFSLNLMTLMALSLVVGILVDDSIVVLENIFRHLEMGKDKKNASLEGRNEIGYTAISITLVDVVVFLPLSAASGLIGNILREFALVVVASTLMSLLVAFTITPLLASRFAKHEPINPNTIWGKIILGFENGLNQIKTIYGNMLYWVLGHKRYLFITVIILMIGAIALVPTGFIGKSFIGNTDQGELTIQLETNPDLPIKQTNLLIRQAENTILQNSEVKHVYTIVGNQTGAKGTAENIGELSVSLIDAKARKLTVSEIATKLRNQITEIPGLQVTIIPTSVTGSVSPALQIAIQNTDLDSVKRAAQMLKTIFQNTAGTDYIKYSTKTNINQITIIPNREKIAQLGLQMPNVTQSIQLAFNGNDEIDYIQNGNTYDVKIEASGKDKQNIDAVKHLALNNLNGQLIELWRVADIRLENVPQILQRINRQSSITVTANASGRPSGDVISDIKTQIAKTPFPKGTQFIYLGDAKNQGDAFSSLGLAMLIGIVLVYMVMVSLYESLVYPFVVLFSIPVALIGAFLILALTMQQLTIFTIIGMIMLLGLVAKNGILIVDFTNHLKQQGLPLTEALVEAGKERLRPIIMTTMAMILGMLPMALSSGSGADFKNGLAWVLIGGLTSSFLLTLFIVPSVYMIIEKLRLRIISKNKGN